MSSPLSASQLPLSAPTTVVPASTATPPSRTGKTPEPIQFGLCGASGGGKTTFLVSLSLAVSAAQQHGLGHWAMVDADSVARKFIEDGQRELVAERAFPPATTVDTSLRWHVWGTRRAKITGRPKDISFTLDVQDVPGVAFLLDDPNYPMPPEMLERLAGADAMIFLVDPVRERGRASTEKSNWSYFDKLVRRISQEHPEVLHNGRLPHHVVVCLTKFDEPSIFQGAFEAGMIDVLPGEQPRVPGDRAHDYFRWICDWVDEIRGDGSTQILHDLLEGSFIPGRVHYFASSSIGFWMRPGQDFDITDYQNFEIVGGRSRLRGPVRPINVLEPLIDLEQRIRLEKR